MPPAWSMAGNEDDDVGGLVGEQNSKIITASYAVGNVDGGAGTGDRVGSLVGDRNSGDDISSRGFGTSTNGELNGIDGSSSSPSDMSVASGTGRTGAALLRAPDPSDTTNTAVTATWNQASSNTADAWDFGSTSDIPALRYADYDGTGSNSYGCGTTTGSAVTIPSTAPDGAGGTITVNCGVTLLPGQGR